MVNKSPPWLQPSFDLKFDQTRNNTKSVAMFAIGPSLVVAGRLVNWRWWVAVLPESDSVALCSHSSPRSSKCPPPRRPQWLGGGHGLQPERPGHPVGVQEPGGPWREYPSLPFVPLDCPALISQPCNFCPGLSRHQETKDGLIWGPEKIWGVAQAVPGGGC